jgi:hypothetical protein
MKRIMILSCTAKKENYPCTAAAMYSKSPNFSKAYEYAKPIGDKIYILSPKYGLLTEDQPIEPYEMSFKGQSVQFLKEWSENILNELKQKTDITNDYFTIITGEKYYQYYLSNLINYSIPLKGKRIGEWIPMLTELINSNQHKVHIKNQIPLDILTRNTQISLRDEIKNYIQKMITDAFHAGETHIDLLSKEIHTHLGLNNRYPSVCAAMYNLQNGCDKLLSAPPKGKGATVKI